MEFKYLTLLVWHLVIWKQLKFVFYVTHQSKRNWKVLDFSCKLQINDQFYIHHFIYNLFSSSKCIFICFAVIIHAVEVNLSGPNFAKRHTGFHVVCSSDQIPLGLTADFFVNEQIYTSLRRSDDGCYSALLKARCPSDSALCSCSKDGKVYELFIHTPVSTNIVTITCSMEFQNSRQVFKSGKLIVQVHG